MIVFSGRVQDSAKDHALQALDDVSPSSERHFVCNLLAACDDDGECAMWDGKMGEGLREAGLYPDHDLYSPISVQTSSMTARYRLFVSRLKFPYHEGPVLAWRRRIAVGRTASCSPRSHGHSTTMGGTEGNRGGRAGVSITSTKHRPASKVWARRPLCSPSEHDYHRHLRPILL